MSPISLHAVWMKISDTSAKTCFHLLLFTDSFERRNADRFDHFDEFENKPLRWGCGEGGGGNFKAQTRDCTLTNLHAFVCFLRISVSI